MSIVFIRFYSSPHCYSSHMFTLPLQLMTASSAVIIVLYIYVHTHVSPFNVTAHMCRCIYLTTWGWITYQGACSSLEKIDSPSVSSHWLPITSHLLGFVKIFPNEFAYQLMLSLCRFCLGNCIVEISGGQFPYCICRHYLPAGVLVLWLLQSFHPLFCGFSLTLRIAVARLIDKLGLDYP